MVRSYILGCSPASVLRLAALCTGALIACARNEFGWRVAPSPISSPRATMPAVQVPDTMTAGVPDTVFIWTESGGCTREGPTDVRSDSVVVTIRLFDSLLVRAPSNYACTSDQRFGRRHVQIRFAHSGLGVVRVVGTDTTEHRVQVK